MRSLLPFLINADVTPWKYWFHLDNTSKVPFLNGPNYFQSPDTRRGLKDRAVRFDVTSRQHLFLKGEKQCAVDFTFCHNGITYALWLNIIDNLSINKTIIFTNFIKLISSTSGSGIQFHIEVHHKDSMTYTRSFLMSTHKWTHLTFTVSESADIRIFLNGKLDDTNTAISQPSPSGSSTSSVEIRVGDKMNGCTMIIDDMHIFEYLLTENEIRRLQGRHFLILLFILFI